jgi:DNA-directed RNA polymerase specialized sigma24 family protein
LLGATIKDEIELIKQNVTPTQWRYLKLHLRGWSYTDIAEKYGICPSTVRITVKRAKKRAKKRLSVLKAC